ncbi:hypothetical protein ACH42_14295 [Endozoicomonas sp. (ex Bugula neritina AB1)]|nr:hypothetical protein ACH42_14295 [Endozoicomonas sp. (ex Bugula neritina AB1)]
MNAALTERRFCFKLLVIPTRSIMIEFKKCIPIGFGNVGRRQTSEALLSPWMECILSNVRNVASSSLQIVGDRDPHTLKGDGYITLASLRKRSIRKEYQ